MVPRPATQGAILSAALSYARRGWRVLPLYEPRNGGCSCQRGALCTSPGKHPRTSGGLSDATADELVICEWWRTWPTANIGIRTGAASGVNVVDIDNRHLGDETMDELEKANDALPLTVEAFTGAGTHLYYRYDEKWRTGSNVLGQGVDVRSDGAYVVAPPSIHVSGREYAWNVDAHPEDISLASAPRWMRDLARAKEKDLALPADGSVDGVRDAEAIERDGARLIAWALKRVADGSGRNDAGFALACQLRDNGFPRHSAWMLMRMFQAQASSGGRRFDHEYTLAEAKSSYTQAFSRQKRDPIPGMVSQVESSAAPAIPPTPQQPAQPANLPRLLSPGEVLLKRDSTSERYTLGIPSIDRATRGIPAGKVITIVGRPGAGKTNLATQISLHMARNGCAVFALWADEGAEASAVRIGQMFGFNREKLEDRDSTEEDSFASYLRGIPYYMVDEDSPDASAEALFDLAEKNANGRQVVVVMDSIQILALEEKKAGSKRAEWEKINAFAKFVKRETKRRGWITIQCSQATRGAYRSKKDVDRDDPLASGGGGSGIEYQADLQLVLDGSIDDFVRVRVAKSRIGGANTKFHLQFDKKAATFREVVSDEDYQTPEQSPVQKAKISEAKDMIRKVLLSSGGTKGMSTNSLYQLTHIKKSILGETLAQMRRDQLVFAEEGPRGAVVWSAARIGGAAGGDRYQEETGAGRRGEATAAARQADDGGVPDRDPHPVAAGGDGGAVRTAPLGLRDQGPPQKLHDGRQNRRGPGLQGDKRWEQWGSGYEGLDGSAGWSGDPEGEDGS